jgi:hypothetical protein
MKKIALFITLFACAVPLFGDSDTKRWSLVGTNDCVEEGKNVVCRLGGGSTATIDVSVKVAGKVTFAHHEYHSACGAASNAVHKETHVIDDDIELYVLAAGPGITCREVYFTGCSVDGTEKACNTVLSAKYSWFKGNQQ